MTDEIIGVGLFEQDRLIARAKKYLVGGRVLDWVPDDYALPTDANGAIRPYLVVNFPPLLPQARDRSLGGEEEQPQVMTVVVNCFAASGDTARQVAAAVRKTFIGWSPSTTASEITTGPGGAFAARTGSPAGSRYLETVALVATINLGPEPGEPWDTDPRA